MAKRIPPPPPPADNDAGVPNDVRDAMRMLIALADDIAGSLASPEILPEFVGDMADILGSLTIQYHGVQPAFAERARHLLTLCRTTPVQEMSATWGEAVRNGVRELPVLWDMDIDMTLK